MCWKTPTPTLKILFDLFRFANIIICDDRYCASRIIFWVIFVTKMNMPSNHEQKCKRNKQKQSNGIKHIDLEKVQLKIGQR